MTERLRELTARFWNLTPGSVDSHLSFSSAGIKGFSSIRFYRFLAAVESQLGVILSDPSRITTLGDMERALTASPASGTQQSPVVEYSVEAMPAVSPSVGLAVGHDVQDIQDFPDPTDPAETAFFESTFTERERTWCNAQQFPRQHYAVRFSAKEAVRKCGPDYVRLSPRQIEICLESDGRPKVVLDAVAAHGRVLSISLSHTGSVASAVVIVGA